VHGSGVGRHLVRELIDRIWTTGVDCAVLECLTSREAFYARSGFRRVVGIGASDSPGLRSVLMRIDSVTKP
jgi:predicted N-acetyltransferase YhbS